MKEEFNLSEKIKRFDDKQPYHMEMSVLNLEDVKEFIKLLKYYIMNVDIMKRFQTCDEIDKLAGEKLI